MAPRLTRRIRLQALTVRLDVVVLHDVLVAPLEDLLSDLVTEAPDDGAADTLVLVGGRGPWFVSAPGHAATAPDLDGVRAEVLAAVNLTAVYSTRQLAVHAAVVSRGGRVVAVPAESGRGKSTLTACLLARGWRYVSDESLCLRWEDGTLVPYPRPLTLSRWSSRAAGLPADHPGTRDEVVHGVAERGWQLDEEPGRLTDVVLLERSGDSPRLEAATSADVMVELIHRSFTLHLDPARALAVLGAAIAAAGLHRLVLGDPATAAHLLDETLTPTTVSRS